MLQYHERIRITWAGIVIGMILSYLIHAWWPVVVAPPPVPLAPCVSAPVPITSRPVAEVSIPVRIPNDPFYDRWN